jgi:uncharacterized membrane protein YdbT with pleckstrin-like domain
MLRLVVGWKLTDVSELLTVAIIRAIARLLNYTAHYPRRHIIIIIIIIILAAVRTYCKYKSDTAFPS